MAKNFMSAALMGAALVFGTAGVATQVFAAVEVSEADQAAFAVMKAAVEVMIVENANDADALKAAVEAYLEASDNPELATKAAIDALTNPVSPGAIAALQSNPDLVTAGAEGIGAAIAVIALTDPATAANMQAAVSANGNASFAEAVQSGNDTKTASINAAAKSQSGSTSSGNQTGETPENPASDT